MGPAIVTSHHPAIRALLAPVRLTVTVFWLKGLFVTADDCQAKAKARALEAFIDHHGLALLSYTVCIRSISLVTKIMVINESGDEENALEIAGR